MKRMVTTLCVVVGLLAATSALALDLRAREPHQPSPLALAPSTVLGCDDGVDYNAYYQATDDRLGNLFDFGTGATLSAASFAHYGYGFAGPYSYDIEVWDPSSCTMVAARNGLSAQNAASGTMVENVDLCSSNLYLSGVLMVGIDPNTCIDPTDCYPDLMWDDQVDVFCPVIINTASTAPACYDVSFNSGPFLFRISVNECATPSKKESWGHLKAIYR